MGLTDWRWQERLISAIALEQIQNGISLHGLLRTTDGCGLPFGHNPVELTSPLGGKNDSRVAVPRSMDPRKDGTWYGLSAGRAEFAGTGQQSLCCRIGVPRLRDGGAD